MGLVYGGYADSSDAAGDSVTLSTGDPVDFDSADSHRLGGRWTWNGGGLRGVVRKPPAR